MGPASRPSKPVTIDLYRRLAIELSDGQAGPSVFYADTDRAHLLLPGLARLGRPVHLLSGNSDAGVDLQARAHPNDDLLRTALVGVDWQRAMSMRDRYAAVTVGPCVAEGCDPRHRHVVRMERHTFATFQDVPANVTWWSANLNCRHPRMRWLPFGAYHEGDGLEHLTSMKRRKKTGLLYVNFAPYTHERMRLKEHFRRLPWVTYRENVPVSQYLDELAEHRYALSPPGNGLDCYRNYEALALGTVPVLKSSDWSAHFAEAGLACVQVGDLFSLSPSDLPSTPPADMGPWREAHWEDLVRSLA